jgi:hypothetical protein
MNDESELVLGLIASTMQFATRHPYAATGIFGAAVGSAVTYGVLTSKTWGPKVNGVLTPKVYELALTSEDLHLLQGDMSYEVRVETPDMTVIVTAEKREPLRALPDIVVE